MLSLSPLKLIAATETTMTLGPYYILPGEQGIKGRLLDDYLAEGYYRMLHTVFTTHYTQLDTAGPALPVFWLRTQLANIRENKNALAIRKKCAGFTVSCSPAAITSETEALYSLYHSAVNFNTGSSCYVCMHDSSMPNPFDSRMIEIRDGATLIAVGYFDRGDNSITGILNFYHPGYKKYSLGKYLMLQKIDWAVANGITLYYTGYICIGNTKFDYKLYPDTSAIEVFLPVERIWLPFSIVGKEGLATYWSRYLS